MCMSLRSVADTQHAYNMAAIFFIIMIFHKYLLSTYYLTGTVLGARDTITKMVRLLALES